MKFSYLKAAIGVRAIIEEKPAPRMTSAPVEFTDRELRDSGVPPVGTMGAAKKEVWALALGIGVIFLLILAAIVDTQL